VANPNGDRKGCQESFVEQCENISCVREPRSTSFCSKMENEADKNHQDKELLKGELDQEMQIVKILKNQYHQMERKMKKDTVMI